MKLRIRWQFFNDENCARFHVDVLLWDSDQLLFTDEDLTDEQELLLESLDGVHGVEGCDVSKYSILVSKGAVFTWDEVLPRVEAVFAEWHGVAMESIDRQEAMRFDLTDGVPDSESMMDPQAIRDIYRRRRREQGDH